MLNTPIRFWVTIISAAVLFVALACYSGVCCEPRVTEDELLVSPDALGVSKESLLRYVNGRSPAPFPKEYPPPDPTTQPTTHPASAASTQP
jgi:hypothetical protein